MKWHKGGLVYAPAGNLWWAKSYATIPTVDVLNDDIIRVYFAALDANQFGRIGYVDLDAKDPRHVIYETTEPVLDIGELGSFDDCGVNPSCVITVGPQKYLYYIGWQRAERVPYMLFCGLAIGDGKSFQRYAHIPILDRSLQEPYTRSATTIIAESDSLRMWYVSALGWISLEKRLYPTYVIRHAQSTDGVHWNSEGNICIDFISDDEFGFGRPWVLKDGSLYKMWYSIRSRTLPYRLGYAESKDGLNWERKDNEIGLVRSDSGWDSEMVCYPCVVDINNKRYMFYNGNRHGSTGFGYAILES